MLIVSSYPQSCALSLWCRNSLWSQSRTPAILTRTIVSGSHHPVAQLRSNRLKAPLSLRRRVRITQAQDKKPTVELARAMPNSCQEMDNSILVTLGAFGHHEARQEILIRHIMATDACTYEEADQTFRTIDQKNSEYMFLLALPYQIGIASAVAIGFASFPMVFHQQSAEWFNHHYVTTDIPEPKDLETMLEVGSWTWNWMEPPLGTMSFILLCMQFARAQIQNLGVKPYTELIKQWRGERLAQAFPQYDARFLLAFSESAAIYKR